MNTKNVLLAVVSLLALGFLSVQAIAADMKGGKGAYVGVQGGITMLTAADSAKFKAVTDPDVKFNTPVALGVFGGYNFNKFVGLELAYTDYGQTKLTSASNPTANTKYSNSAASLSVVGMLPLGPVSLFGTLGAAEVMAKQKGGNSQSYITGMYGAGVRVAVKKVGVSLRYNGFLPELKDKSSETKPVYFNSSGGVNLSAAMLGVDYHF